MSGETQEAARPSGDAGFAAATKDRAVELLLAMGADAVLPNAVEQAERVLFRRPSPATRRLLWDGCWARTAEEVSERAKWSELAAAWA